MYTYIPSKPVIHLCLIIILICTRSLKQLSDNTTNTTCNYLFALSNVLFIMVDGSFLPCIQPVVSPTKTPTVKNNVDFPILCTH